jgi:hypothetical protein
METMNYLTCACCIAVVHPEDDDHECFAAALAFEPELPA